MTQRILLCRDKGDVAPPRKISMPHQLCQRHPRGTGSDLQTSQEHTGMIKPFICDSDDAHMQKKPLPLETPTIIELEPGENIQVTLFDANHCPGAAMFCKIPTPTHGYLFADQVPQYSKVMGKPSFTRAISGANRGLYTHLLGRHVLPSTHRASRLLIPSTSTLLLPNELDFRQRSKASKS